MLLSVFKELGRLAVGGDEETPAPAGPGLPPGPHVFFDHPPLWNYCNPMLARPFADSVPAPDIFRNLPPGTTVEEAARHTRFFVFLGAEKSPALDAALNVPGSMCLLFESDPGRMQAFLAANKAWCLSRANLFFIVGEPDGLNPPLLFFLPEELTRLGFPVVFGPQALAAAAPDDSALAWALRVCELAELFYYRHVIYSLEGQENARGMPLRSMVRNAIYDRYVHFYRNLAPCLQSGVLGDLAGLFPGRTAVLVAAGPALNDGIEFVRKNRGRCVLIAVNTALKALLAAGITPHFTVINDTSIDAGKAFQGLTPMASGALVPHCLSESASGLFPRSFFFGNFPGQPFPKRDGLLLHGSVITTAFSLAEHLGCTRAVLVGAQLCSPDPWRMSYAKGTRHDGESSMDQPLTGRWDQLYPVRAADGRRMYTTLNFLDAGQWFCDRIRSSGIPVVNTCPTSILAGPGIVLDENPPMPEPFDADAVIDAMKPAGFPGAARKTLELIRLWLGEWKQKQRAARAALATGDLAVIDTFVAGCDADNSSFMLQRFEDFANAQFHVMFFFADDYESRMKGANYFCGYMDRMCATLLAELTRQHQRIEALLRQGAVS